MTPEQLELEGWHKVAVDQKYFVMATDQVESRWFELGYDTTTKKLQILKAYQHPAGFKTRETIYNGKCPDIETFKQLSKLLEL